MTDDLRQRRATDRHPRYLLPILVVLIAIGAVSVLVTIQTGQQQQLARETSLQEAFELLEELDEQQVSRAETSREAHYVMCQNIKALAEDAGVPVSDCPDHRNHDDADNGG